MLLILQVKMLEKNPKNKQTPQNDGSVGNICFLQAANKQKNAPCLKVWNNLLPHFLKTFCNKSLPEKYWLITV